MQVRIGRTMILHSYSNDGMQWGTSLVVDGATAGPPPKLVGFIYGDTEGQSIERAVSFMEAFNARAKETA